MADPKTIQKAALNVTKWVGSPFSIVVHTLIFVGSFLAVSLDYIAFERMLLVLTTLVSLEAIYLSIFIQMTINYTTASIEEVGKDIDEIQEDIDEMQEDVEEIQEDVDELQEDVEEISEGVDEMTEEEKEEKREDEEDKRTLVAIQTDLRKLMSDIEKLQQNHHQK